MSNKAKEIVKFQFREGAIKSNKRTGSYTRTTKFQFREGAIKSPPTKIDN